MKLSKKSKKILYRVCYIVCLITFIVCAGMLIFYYWDSYQSEKKVDDLKNLIVEESYEVDIATTEDDGDSDNNTPDVLAVPDFVEIDGVMVQTKFHKLYQRNTDFIGWITIEGTDIDYPVMQSMYDE